MKLTHAIQIAACVAWLVGLLLPVDAALLTFSARDDHAKWKETETVAPVIDAPTWVITAAGSSPFEEQDELLSVTGRQPGSRDELVGYSALEADTETALAGAQRSAVTQLQALILWDLREKIQRGAPVPYVQLTAAEIRRQLDGLTRDRYDGWVDRPYARVHRTAILVRIDAVAWGALQRGVSERFARAHEELAARQQRLCWKVAISGVLSLVALFGYASLNGATRGYLSWRLRFLLLLVWGAIYTGVFTFMP